MFLACEDKAPYGPSTSTASLFLDLMCRAAQISSSSSDDDEETYLTIRMTIYQAKECDYPTSTQEWDTFNGIILPGSFSTAYETNVKWIQHLQEVIKNEIFAKERKTWGICFGHQVYAHAFRTKENKGDGSNEDDGGGCAMKCPAGLQLGHCSYNPTKEGIALFSPFVPSSPKEQQQQQPQTNFDLLCSHGDMVSSLPSFAISLGSNDAVPIQAAAYFSSSQDVTSFQTTISSSSSDGDDNDERKLVLPHAITFQAHPEFATKNGYYDTYLGIVQK
eukprot:14803360-Ditylum_brightwellii.AAC.1